jgi:hypothetical protein
MFKTLSLSFENIKSVGLFIHVLVGKMSVLFSFLIYVLLKRYYVLVN